MTDEMETRLLDYCPQLKVCGCGGCGRVLVSDSERKKYKQYVKGIEGVYVSPRGVPFCRGCSSAEGVQEVLRLRKGRGAK